MCYTTTVLTELIQTKQFSRRRGEHVLSLDLQSRRPIYEQLVQGLMELISMGVLAPDTQLPSVRSMARDLGINPNTVQKAYQELERNGITYSVAGKGSFIAKNQNANEVLLHQSVEKIKSAVREGRRAGMDRAQVDAAVEQAFEEEIQ